MNEIKLKKCPFCNGELNMGIIPYETENSLYPIVTEAFIECSKCGCKITGNTTEEVITKWNRRKPINNIINTLESKLKEVEKHAINDKCRFGEYYATTRAIKIVKECAE